MARTRQQQQRGAEHGTDLTRTDLPKRPDPMARILGLYERLVRLRPELSEPLLTRCKDLTERYRPLGQERVLGVAEAVRFTGLTPTRIQQLGKEGRIGEFRDGRWRFSEAE